MIIGRMALFLVVMISFLGYSHAQELDLADSKLLALQKQTVMPFLEALKNGKVAQIRKYISPNLYEKNRVLLEQNKEYPAFLQKFYKDVTFSVLKAEKEKKSEAIIFLVAMKFPSGGTSLNELRVSPQTAGNDRNSSWFIDMF